MTNKEKITYFAETDARGKKVPFGIKAKDRTRHMYVIGKTGMGKSTLLENMAVQDIQNGEGFAFVDPHGKTADLLLDYIPEERMKDVIYFAPFDMDNPISFNIMEDVGYDKRHLVVAGLMSAFKKIWVDMWSARMEYILSNVLLGLLEYPNSTLLGVNRMLVDKDYRKAVVDNITDPSAKSFWVDEFAKYTDRYTQDATPAIQNKVGQFTANPLIRNIIGQPKSSFDIRKMMDEKKILIINLSKGQIGEGNANLLGSMLITKIYLAAMSRADLPEAEMQKLPNFYLYVDEFQSFANESFADVLSEARKYKLNLTIAHQYIEQMSDEVRSAVFGNVGTMVTFRVGAFDAEVLEKEFAPVFTAEDLVNLGFTQVYLKLMIDGIGSHPFSATTLPPIAPPEKSLRKEVIESSRKLFSHPRVEVNKAIEEWYKPIVLPRKEPAKTSPGPAVRPTMPQTILSGETKKEWKPTRAVHVGGPREGNRTITPRPSPRKEFPRQERREDHASNVAPARGSYRASGGHDATGGPKPVSLDVLKKGLHKTPPRATLGGGNRDDGKGPTPGKMKTLKEALADAMKERGEGKLTPMPKPAPKKENTVKEKTEVKAETKPEIQSGRAETPKEVPEETLKKILE